MSLELFRNGRVPAKAGTSVRGERRILVVLLFLTVKQCEVYYDLPTLWRDTIEKNPQSAAAYNNLGVYLINQGEEDEAYQLFRQSLKIKPEKQSRSTL